MSTTPLKNVTLLPPEPRRANVPSAPGAEGFRDLLTRPDDPPLAASGPAQTPARAGEAVVLDGTALNPLAPGYQPSGAAQNATFSHQRGMMLDLKV